MLTPATKRGGGAAVKQSSSISPVYNKLGEGGSCGAPAFFPPLWVFS